MWIPRRSSFLIALALLFAAPAEAASLTVLAPASAAAGLRPLAAQYTASTGIAVTVGGGSRAKVVEALKTGPADVVVLPTADMAELPNVTAMTPLGRITVGMAVKAGAKVPDISTPEKFRAVLLAAKGVAYADPAAGTSAGEVIDTMLSAPEFKGVRRVPVQGLAVTALASGKADIALQMLPELAADKDVALAGPVPSAYGAGVDFSAGIASVTNDAEAAETFVVYLADPKNAALWRKNGLDPLFH
ncbi:MAG TPA: substrate-binding domain-containing protein [Rhizomicrobium sp.]|jgi:molybdate transport system substrate-binding protein|nr:substrate-binding domain-containing protein [Rhizomicrobium sp.]